MILRRIRTRMRLIMAGEGDGDAAVFVLGMLMGAAFAHNFSAASSGAGVGPMGILRIVAVSPTILPSLVFE